MNTIERIHQELEGARKSLNELLGVPSTERGADFAAKRDSLTEQVKGLAADYSAAQLAQASEGEKQMMAEREAKAVNRLNIPAQQEVKKENQILTLDEFRKDFKSEGSVVLPFGLKSGLHSIKANIDRADMNPDPSYQELNLKPVRRPQIIDFLPSGQTDQTAVTYRRGVVTPTAAPRLENQTLAEFTQTATKITDPIEVIGSVTTVSMEEYQDDGQFGLVLQEMAADVLRELDEQVMIGNGTSPNLRGITTTASPQTEAYATSRLNTIYAAMMALMTTERAKPNLLAFRPSDWVLIQNDIVTASYSAVQYVQNGLTPLLYGVPVVLHEDLTSGVGLVLDPALYAVIYRQGLVVESTNSNGTNFNNLQLSIRAYVRAALKTRRLGCRLIDLTS